MAGVLTRGRRGGQEVAEDLDSGTIQICVALT